jgi:hypothetical protein
MTARQAEASTQKKLAELTFVVGSQTRDRLDHALAQAEAGALAMTLMVRDGAIYDSAEPILCMVLRALGEIRSATENLSKGLDEIVDDESFADWAEEHGGLDALGWTRERVIGLRRNT